MLDRGAEGKGPAYKSNLRNAECGIHVWLGCFAPRHRRLAPLMRISKENQLELIWFSRREKTPVFRKSPFVGNQLQRHDPQAPNGRIPPPRSGWLTKQGFLKTDSAHLLSATLRKGIEQGPWPSELASSQASNRLWHRTNSKPTCTYSDTYRLVLDGNAYAPSQLQLRRPWPSQCYCIGNGINCQHNKSSGKPKRRKKIRRRTPL
ncbi:hypothetical protein V8C37DRAFT_217527 [Trichoderma ceciliae]